MKKRILVLYYPFASPCPTGTGKQSWHGTTRRPIPNGCSTTGLHAPRIGYRINRQQRLQSDDEPSDAYCNGNTVWAKRPERAPLPIREGKDAGAVWQFLEFWDPAAAEARIVQSAATAPWAGQDLAAGRRQR